MEVNLLANCIQGISIAVEMQTPHPDFVAEPESNLH